MIHMILSWLWVLSVRHVSWQWTWKMSWKKLRLKVSMHRHRPCFAKMPSMISLYRFNFYHRLLDIFSLRFGYPHSQNWFGSENIFLFKIDTALKYGLLAFLLIIHTFVHASIHLMVASEWYLIEQNGLTVWFTVRRFQNIWSFTNICFMTCRLW